MPVRDPEHFDSGLISRGRTVVGVFERQSGVERAVEEVRRQGWADDAVSVVFREAGEAQPDRAAEDTGAARGAATGVAIGGVAGGVLAGLASIMLPGVGILLAAGPVVSAISGAALGGSWGGLIGSILGLGVPDEHAREYERAVREGGYLLAVRAEDKPDADRLTGIFQAAGARATNDYEYNQ